LLDGVTSKLWSFAQGLLWSSSRFDSQKFGPVLSLIQESCKLLVFQAVARNCRFYTTAYAAELETCSPFRFQFFRDRERSFTDDARKIISLLRRRRKIVSPFDLVNGD